MGISLLLPSLLCVVILQIAMTQAPPTQPAPDDATPSLRSERVAEAVLHFIRLGASHANYGITFTDLDLVPDATDPVSLKALEDVVEIMMKDRARVCGKMTDVLTERTHRIVSEAFEEAQHDPATEQNVEDVIARRLRERLGLELSADEEKKLTVGAQFIKDHGGPSNAAATALGRAFGLETGRSIYNAATKSHKAPPIPGPLNRWVPQRHLRKYLSHLLGWVEALRRAAPLLPLSELRDTTQFEPIIDRVERCFREDARARIEEQMEVGLEVIGGVLRGNPIPEKYAQHWAPHQVARLDVLRAQIAMLETQLSDREPVEAARIMNALIRTLSEFWIAELMKDFDLA